MADKKTSKNGGDNGSSNISKSGSTIQFKESELPRLKCGSHSVVSDVHFTVGKDKSSYKNQLHFDISGPRFLLSPKEIQSVFPPKNSHGEFENCLPHIVLSRPTLPWQRYSDSDSKDENTPWLALIVLQEGENYTKVKMDWLALRKNLNLGEEIGDLPEEGQKSFPPVDVLSIDPNLLASILASPEELQWLSHVRESHNKTEQPHRSVLVANRMPLPGKRAEVHLVSLEGRFKAEKFTLPSDGNVKILSLHSWKFSIPDEQEFKVSSKALKKISVELGTKANGVFDKLIKKFDTPEKQDALFRGIDTFKSSLPEFFSKLEEDKKNVILKACKIKNETFKGLADHLDIGWLRMDIEEKNAHIDAGSCPVSFGMRNGGKTAAWYRGPLVAGPLSSDVSNQLPIRNSDVLLQQDAKTGMLDASYAAAWELGRLQMVANPKMSQQISQWKTSHAREAAVTEQKELFGHLPFQDSSFAHEPGGLLEQNLQQHFQRLSLLKDVPFQYLVPNEKFLPHESMRLFHLDTNWVECMLDGAFSIGRHTMMDLTREKEKEGMKPQEKVEEGYTGFLLRSDLVSGWPALEIDGYKVKNPKYEPTNKKILPIVRRDILGSNVMIVIFKGIVKHIDIHLHPEGLHFGFSRSDSDHNDDYYKELKSLDSGEELDSTKWTNVAWKKVNGKKNNFCVIDPIGFWKGANLSVNGANMDAKKVYSHYLALELLEGVPRLQITI